jgi:hypothetical protein
LVLKVSQALTLPLLNQRCRWALLPWVKLSGTTASLERTAANFCGSAHGVLDIALLQNLAGVLGLVRPDAGKAVRLQLQPNAQLVVLNLTDPAAPLLHLAGDAHQVLHMVADLVCNHMGLGKITGRTQTIFQGFIKPKVDVDLLVAGAVKRPYGGLSLAAGRLGGAAKQHQAWLLVRAAALGEHVFPHVFGVGQHGGNKAGHAVVGGWPLGRFLLDLAMRGAARQRPQDGERVDAKNPGAEQLTATRAVAPVLKVVGLQIAFPFHD